MLIMTCDVANINVTAEGVIIFISIKLPLDLKCMQFFLHLLLAFCYFSSLFKT